MAALLSVFNRNTIKNKKWKKKKRKKKKEKTWHQRGQSSWEDLKGARWTQVSFVRPRQGGIFSWSGQSKSLLSFKYYFNQIHVIALTTKNRRMKNFHRTFSFSGASKTRALGLGFSKDTDCAGCQVLAPSSVVRMRPRGDESGRTMEVVPEHLGRRSSHFNRSSRNLFVPGTANAAAFMARSHFLNKLFFVFCTVKYGKARAKSLAGNRHHWSSNLSRPKQGGWRGRQGQRGSAL